VEKNECWYIVSRANQSNIEIMNSLLYSVYVHFVIIAVHENKSKALLVFLVFKTYHETACIQYIIIFYMFFKQIS
jgi:hypothetical protein